MADSFAWSRRHDTKGEAEDMAEERLREEEGMEEGPRCIPV